MKWAHFVTTVVIWSAVIWYMIDEPDGPDQTSERLTAAVLGVFVWVSALAGATQVVNKINKTQIDIRDSKNVNLDNVGNQHEE